MRGATPVQSYICILYVIEERGDSWLKLKCGTVAVVKIAAVETKTKPAATSAEIGSSVFEGPNPLGVAVPGVGRAGQGDGRGSGNLVLGGPPQASRGPGVKSGSARTWSQSICDRSRAERLGESWPDLRGTAPWLQPNCHDTRLTEVNECTQLYAMETYLAGDNFESINLLQSHRTARKARTPNHRSSHLGGRLPV